MSKENKGNPTEASKGFLGGVAYEVAFLGSLMNLVTWSFLANVSSRSGYDGRLQIAEAIGSGIAAALLGILMFKRDFLTRSSGDQVTKLQGQKKK